MRVLSAQDVAAALDYPTLIDRLAAAFRAGPAITVPVRHHHAITGPAATLLLMPAWDDRFLGVKVATVYPGNVAKGLASVMATYLLLDGTSGAPLALIDGRELTLRRTAAASALASRCLSRPDSRHLLMVGTGALAPHLARAHTQVRPIRQVTIWGRTPAKVEKLADDLGDLGVSVSATESLARAVMEADIISCATMAHEPLIRGAWLTPGVHVDLVGGYTPQMREADDATMTLACIYVDTREGALKEAGDIVDPMTRGVIAIHDVIGDLFDLAGERCPRRLHDGDITLFKSVGSAIEDLAGAALAFERAQAYKAP